MFKVNNKDTRMTPMAWNMDKSRPKADDKH